MMHNFIVGKISGETGTFKKLLSSEEAFYQLPDNLTNATEYTPNDMIDEGEWYAVKEFAVKEFCLEILKKNFNTDEYEQYSDVNNEVLDFIFAYQNRKYYYFQRIPKSQFLKKKFMTLGDTITFETRKHIIVIKEQADAIYSKKDDILYFKKLSDITAIFKGIDQLYREATEEEIKEFLKFHFIQLDADFSSEKVKVANRKRIALAQKTLNELCESDKKNIFNYITKYVSNLHYENNKFTISSEEDLKNLLFGIEQRFYTTEVGNEKRIAKAISKIE